jgi:hypothetical protein
MINFDIATEEQKATVGTDSEDAYVDACNAESGVACTYCCILSKGECSRDIRACDPILVDNRKFENLYIMIACLLGVVCGCPLVATIMNCCMTTRFFAESYEATQGVTCMELISRCLLFCCIKFDEVRKKASASDDLFGEQGEEDAEAPPAEEKPAPSAPLFHAIDPHNLNMNEGPGPLYDNGGDNDDKMNLIDAEAGSSAAKIVGRDTRNARNQRFNPGTNGATESPSMEMDLQ